MTPSDRWDPERALRVLEAGSLASTAGVILLTYLTVSTGQLREANPLTEFLFRELGWHATAAILLLTVAGLFTVLRTIARDGPPGWAPSSIHDLLSGSHTRVALLCGSIFTAVRFSNLTADSYQILSTGALPETVILSRALLISTLVIGLSAALYYKKQTTRLLRAGISYQTAKPVAACLLLISSSFAGASLGAVVTDEGNQGSLSNLASSEIGYFESDWESQSAGEQAEGMEAGLEVKTDSTDPGGDKVIQSSNDMYVNGTDYNFTDGNLTVLMNWNNPRKISIHSPDDGMMIEFGSNSNGNEEFNVDNNDLSDFTGNQHVNTLGSGWTYINIVSNGSTHEVYAWDYGGTKPDSPMFSVNKQLVAENGEVFIGTAGYTHTVGSIKVVGDASGVVNTEPDISGKVTDQSGSAISNASVVAYAATYSSKSVSQSRNEVEKLSDPIPSSWRDLGETQPLLGNGGAWSQDDLTSYVSTHTREAITETAPWIDSSDLDGTASIGLKQPLPADTPIPLIAWDADATGVGVNRCLPGIGSEYNCQMPGKHKKDATIVIERIGPGGDIVQRSTVQTDQTSGAGFADPDRLKYAEVELSAGFYYIHEEGAPKGLPRRVGRATELIDRYQEDADGQLSDRAKQVKNEIEQSNLVRLNTSTNATGNYNFSVPDGTKVVTVQAYHAPALIRDAGLNPSTLTTSTILSQYNSAIQTLPEDRTEVQTAIASSSVYFPSRTRTVEPPNRDVDMTLYELSSPPGANISAVQGELDRLRDLIENGTFSELPPALQQRLEEINNTEELQEVRDELNTLADENEELRERYIDVLEEQRNQSEEEIKQALQESDKTNQELREEINALRQALTEMDTTIEIEEPDVERSAESVSLAWGVPTDVSAGNVSVIAHYANGTSSVVPDEYVKLDTNALGSDSVRLEKYPLGETDPASVQFELRVANGEDLGGQRQVVKNPTFNGELPRLDSIRLSSLTPGPDQRVDVTVNPSEAGSFRKVTGATVYGPDGGTINVSNVTEGNSFGFGTSGAGVYRLELTMETTGGSTFELPVQIKAGQTDLNRPPTVTARDSPVGQYALTSGAIERAEIEQAGAGDTSNVVVQLKKGDRPSNVDVHLEELTTPRETRTTVTLVEGDEQQAVDQHIPVTVHYKAPADNVLVWRNGDAIPKEGSSLGTRRDTGKSLVVETYTDENGRVEIRKLNSPSLGQSTSFWINLQIQRIPDLPDLPFLDVQVPTVLAEIEASWTLPTLALPTGVIA